MKNLSRLAASVAALAPVLALAATPQYTITDLGAVAPNRFGQAFGISPDGGTVIGRSLDDLTTTWPAMMWQAGTGTTALGGVAGFDFYAGYGANNAGTGVGIAAKTSTGSGAMPVLWKDGQATLLNLPAGTPPGGQVGRAYAINGGGIAVGSAGGGSAEQAVLFDTNTGTSTRITARSADAGRAYMATAFGISDNGLVVGVGVDIDSRNVALMYDTTTRTMTQIVAPAQTGAYTALAFDISSNGQFVSGSYGNDGRPFVWSAATGVITADLPPGTGSGSLRAVNDAGWAVGTAGGQYANPFLFADGQTYRLGDLIVNGGGWNFATTTSAAAAGIGNNGSIAGTAQFNGFEHAYLMTPVPEPATYALMFCGLAAVGIARRRSSR